MSADPTRSTRWVRIGSLVLLTGSLCAGAVAAIIAILSSHFEEDIGAAMFFTCLNGVLLACLGLGCAGMIEKQINPRIMWCALAIGIVASAGWITMMWVAAFQNSPPPALAARIDGTLTLIVLGLAIGGALTGQRSESTLLTIARYGSATTCSIYLLWCVHLIWTSWWTRWDDLLGPATTFAGLLQFVVLVILALALRNQKKARGHKAESIASKIMLRMTCPKCGEEQSLSTGLVKCRSCRCALLIEVQEPRCECGYLLYKLQGDVCPECGRPVQQPVVPPIVAPPSPVT